MAKERKQRFEFKGNIKDDSILVGSHGDATIKIEGTFDLSGIIYCPRYTVMISIRGDGKVAFRGKCDRIIVKKMKGNCILDLSDLTCKELQCESMRQKATIIVGKARVITKANLADESEMHLDKRPLITSSFVTGNSRIIHRAKTLQASVDGVTPE